MTKSIEVNNITKKFRRGSYSGYLTLRDSIWSLITSPSDLIGNWGGSNNLEENEFWALKDISFSVEPGEVVGIIGQNGSGKSTLLKILSRITPPTCGQATIFGKIASLLEVGTGFSPELTGRENIFLSGAILGMKQREVKAKFDEIVDFSGVEHFLDTPVKRYSSGMYVRLAFAVTAYLETDILLVDEILSVGDAEFQRKSLGRMEKVTKESGKTILYVSHNMESVQSLCDKVVLLEKGRLIEFSEHVSDVVSLYLKKSGVTSEINLNDRNLNRKGNGLARFTNLQIMDPSGRRIKNITEGKPFKLILTITAKKDLEVKIVSVTFIDSNGHDILTSFVDDSLEVKKLSRGKNSFILQINPNPFVAGIITLRLACLGKNFIEYDHIAQAAALMVQKGSDSKKISPSRPGVINIPIMWSKI